MAGAGMTCSMTPRVPHRLTGWLEAECQEAARVSDLPYLLPLPKSPLPKERGP